MLRPLLAGLLSASLLCGCTGQTPTPTATPNHATDRAPSQPTPTYNRCDDPQRHFDWPGGPDVNGQPIPVPCNDLFVSVWTSDQHWTTAGTNSDYGTGPTKKVWVQVTSQANGHWRIRWGTAPGICAEWLLAVINTPKGGVRLPIDTFTYDWRPFANQTYPTFDAYARLTVCASPATSVL